MNQVPWANAAVAGDPGAAGGEILEGVLSEMVAALKEHRTPVEVHAMLGASFCLSLRMTHRTFRVPRPWKKY